MSSIIHMSLTPGAENPPAVSLDTFQPGQIISLVVRDFMGIDQAEFQLGPENNLIPGIGSKILMAFSYALYFGLGGLYIEMPIEKCFAKGKSKFEIEVKMKNRVSEPDIHIRRISKLHRSITEWFLNGQPSSNELVDSTVAELNIQLSSKLNFVFGKSDFKQLFTPQSLLLHVEKTNSRLGLHKGHKNLMKHEEKKQAVIRNIAALRDLIKVVTERISALEVKIDNCANYQKNLLELELHEVLLYRCKKASFEKEKCKLEAEKASLQDSINNIEGLIGTDQEAFQLASESADEAKLKVDGLKLDRAKLQDSLDKHESEEEEAKRKTFFAKRRVDEADKNCKEMKDELERLRQEKERIESFPDIFDSSDKSNLDLLEAELLKTESASQNLKDEIEELSKSLVSLKADEDSFTRKIAENCRNLKSKDRLAIFEKKASRFPAQYQLCARAHRILKEAKASNPELKYHEAPVISCRAKNKTFAKYIEKALGESLLLSLYLENENDESLVERILGREISGKISYVVGPSRTLNENESTERNILAPFGFTGYTSDYLEGPEFVVEACKQNTSICSLPIFDNDLNPTSMKEIEKMIIDKKVSFHTFFAGSYVYSMTKSKYGDAWPITELNPVSEAKFLGSDGFSFEDEQELRKESALLEKKKEEAIKSKLEETAQLAESQSKYSLKKTRVRELNALISPLAEEEKSIIQKPRSLEVLETKVQNTTTLLLKYEQAVMDAGWSSAVTRSVQATRLVGNSRELLAQKEIDLGKLELDLNKAKILRVTSKNNLKARRDRLAELRKDHDKLISNYNAHLTREPPEPMETEIEVRFQDLQELGDKYDQEGQFNELHIEGIIRTLRLKIKRFNVMDKDASTLLSEEQAALRITQLELTAEEARLQRIVTKMGSEMSSWQAESDSGD